MANYERTYGTARTIYTLLEAISWVVAIGGIVVCIVGISALGSVRSEMEAIGAFVGIIAGVLFALIGLLFRGIRPDRTCNGGSGRNVTRYAGFDAAGKFKGFEQQFGILGQRNGCKRKPDKILNGPSNPET